MRAKFLAVAVLVLAPMTARAQASPDAEELRRFFTGPVYLGPISYPDFRGRDRPFNAYRTRLREGVSMGVNFASNFRIISFGCGAGCAQVYLADIRNGLISNVPIGGEDMPYLRMVYAPKSSALIAYWQSEGGCFRRVLNLTTGGFQQFQAKKIGPEETCTDQIRANVSAQSNLDLGPAPTPTTSAYPSVPAIPAAQSASLDQQAGFIAAIAAARTDYAKGANDMAKGAARPARAKNVCAALKGYSAANWIGRVAKLSSNSDGNGVLFVEIAPRLTLKTWSNDFSDLMDRTLIPASSKLFNQASSLSEGQQVRFSGQFIPAENDCVREGSLSLRGSIEAPEYIFRFSEIHPL